MIGRLNHIGIATPSIDESVAMYRDFMGATSVTEKWAMPEQGVWVCFVNLPNSQIELIEPYGDKSPIHAFLEKNPKGGQHHVCFEVPDIYIARDEMKAKGWRPKVVQGGRRGPSAKARPAQSPMAKKAR